MEKYNNILERFFNVEVQLKKLNTVQCLQPPGLPLNIIAVHFYEIKLYSSSDRAEWKQKYQDNLPASKQILFSQCNFKQVLHFISFWLYFIFILPLPPLSAQPSFASLVILLIVLMYCLYLKYLHSVLKYFGYTIQVLTI